MPFGVITETVYVSVMPVGLDRATCARRRSRLRRRRRSARGRHHPLVRGRGGARGVHRVGQPGRGVGDPLGATTDATDDHAVPAGGLHDGGVAAGGAGAALGYPRLGAGGQRPRGLGEDLGVERRQGARRQPGAHGDGLGGRARIEDVERRSTPWRPPGFAGWTTETRDGGPRHDGQAGPGSREDLCLTRHQTPRPRRHGGGDRLLVLHVRAHVLDLGLPGWSTMPWKLMGCTHLRGGDEGQVHHVRSRGRVEQGRVHIVRSRRRAAGEVPLLGGAALARRLRPPGRPVDQLGHRHPTAREDNRLRDPRSRRRPGWRPPAGPRPAPTPGSTAEAPVSEVE